MPERETIVGIGEILWDRLPAGKQLGGAPANFAYHGRALGADGVVVSRVGDDDLGHEILKRLDALGVDRTHVSVDPRHTTGTVNVRVDGAGVPEYVIHENVAWDFLDASPSLLDLARRAHAVCFGTLAQRLPASRGAIGRFLRAAGPSCLRVFDINFRQHYFGRDLVREMLGLCDVLKLNDAELPVLADLLGVKGAVPVVIEDLMRQYPLKVVALTRGAAGSALFTPDRVSDHPGVPPATIVDTVGAGDAFTAALVVGLLGGHDLDRINAVAARLASYVCTQPGATPPIPEGLRAEARDEATGGVV